jgi:ADP-ribosyl-[dinitrogen reductase] hydrolase
LRATGEKAKGGASVNTIGRKPADTLGTAMRAGPLGALYADRPELLAHAVMPSSLITHSDIRPASLAYTVAWANLTRVNGKSPRQIRKE